MTHFTRMALASAILAALGGAPAARAQFTVGFEDAAVPATGTLAAPSTADAAATLSAAYGTDTVQGVTFSDDFTVFRDTYTNDVGGSDLYGSTRGALALTNIVNPPGAFATAPDTGPGDPGPDGLTFTTGDVLTGLYAGSVDYGDGTPGAATLTITAFGPGGDLAHDTVALDTTAFALSHLDTSNFAPFAGQITGYRVNRTLPNDAETQLGGGGNYALDDLSFAAPAPEPSAPVGLAVGLFSLVGMIVAGRRAR